ncbi:SAE2-domain-containing protein [Clathrospora elynae]|uniref:SAE2-domain-containing protein n=1 Tax=Clathrospora elynae TaxID=706981 RepID=A0A6A5T2C4_9PLEO|nr:SAE2-domain-containing protein [Clathrospora elynae]
MADFSAWVEKNKTLWTRVYDEVITPDLEKEWKKREEIHEKELKQTKENRQIWIDHLEEEIEKTARLAKENDQLKHQLEVRDAELAKSARLVEENEQLGEENGQLTAENEQLKEQIQKQHEFIQQPSRHEGANVDASTVTKEEYGNLPEKYSEMSKKYQDASQEVKYLKRKNGMVMQKNKEMKESVRAWQDYVDRQAGKQKPRNEIRAGEGTPRLLPVHAYQDDRPHMPSSPRSVATIRTPRSLADLGRSSPAPMVPLPRSVLGTTDWSISSNTVAGEEDRSPSASVTPKALGRLEQDNDDLDQDTSHIRHVYSVNERHGHQHLQPANPSSSQTTVDEHIEQSSRNGQAMDAVDDDDVPQIVSERSLKRKRGQPSKSRIEMHADHSSEGTPAKPYHVKEEQYSSPPTSAYRLLRTETMDLDDPTPNILKTPRHPRRKPSMHPGITDIPRQQRSNSAPLTQDIKRENTSGGHMVGNAVPDLSGRVTELPGPQVIATTEIRASSEPTEPTQVEHTVSVLRTLDQNILSSSSEESPNKRLWRAEIQHEQKHGFLTESGETPPPMDDGERRLPPHIARAQMNRRLQAKKNPQTPAKSIQKTPKSRPTKIKPEVTASPPKSSRSTNTPSRGTGLRNLMSEPRSKPREGPSPDRPIWEMKAPETRSSARRSRVSPSKEQTRLRDRPVTELSVHDFKTNPTYNQGYSYAFSETVRKRGDRMCLPGCTNAQCCGSTFRTLAEAQAPLSSSQEEVLLEDYLGDAYNNMQLTQMSSEEREELVLQARAKKMAKESGKHRQAYERPKSPPGYWRLDFPTTQEQLDDREKAKVQERLIVQERWREAQRKGGMWIFKDE